MKKPLFLENYTSEFRNPYVLTPKLYCFACQTLVFDESNNIVSLLKQYCLTGESQMFGRRKGIIRSFVFQKVEGVNKSEAIKRIGKTGRPIEKGRDTPGCAVRCETERVESASMCILRIA